MSQITLIPYNNNYYIHHHDDVGRKKCVGKIPSYCLQTAIWFYTLDNMDVFVLEDNMDAIDDYFEKKMKDVK